MPLFTSVRDVIYQEKVSEKKKNKAEDDLTLPSPTVFEIRGSKYLQKHPSPLIFGEILIRLCCLGDTLNAQLRQIF